MPSWCLRLFCVIFRPFNDFAFTSLPPFDMEVDISLKQFELMRFARGKSTGTVPRQQTFRVGLIWQAQLGESLVMLIGPSRAPKFVALL